MSIGRRIRRLLILAVPVLLLSVSSPLLADDCEIYGTSTAGPSDRPDLGQYRYDIVIHWDTGTVYGLSHLDIIMDDPGGNCYCDDFIEAIHYPDPAGSATGVPDPCQIMFYGELICDGGDPSLPDVEGDILKFEPYEAEDCEPGVTGVATFTIYSDFAPATVAQPNMFLVDKFGQLNCWGNLSGDWPAMPCDPVDAQGSTWGSLKGIYR